MIKYTRLYEFSLAGRVWRYAGNAEDIVDVENRVWEAATISDDGPSQSGESVSDMLTISCASRLTVPSLFRFAPPGRVVGIRVLEATYADKPVAENEVGIVDEPASRSLSVIEHRVIYDGEVEQCSFPQPGTATIKCVTISDTMSQLGLRGGWQRQCPHSIYDESCKVDKSAHALSGTISAINGNSITITGLGTLVNGHFNGGILDYTHPVKGPEALAIEQQTGNVFLIFGSASDLWLGMSVSVAPGCDQTPTRCINTFDNYDNNGGFGMLPLTSPFNGINNPAF